MCPTNDPVPWWQAFEDELVARGVPLPPDYVTFRDANKRLPDQEAAITQKLHEVVDAFEGGPNALCLSGGGIRSATFSIGVIQGLAKNNVLSHLDYVSTVSGGGYAGSWLSSWARRDGGIDGVSHELGHGIGGGVFAPEASPLAYLRRFCAYLNPHSGGMSADTWTIVATYLRNLLLTWSVLLPLILGALILPRIGAAITGRWIGSWTANEAYRLLVLGASLACASLAFAFVGLSLPSSREMRPEKTTANEERRACAASSGSA